MGKLSGEKQKYYALTNMRCLAKIGPWKTISDFLNPESKMS